MAHSIVMPALEMAQETGKLISWRKKEGEAIGKGEPLLEIETDKAVVEIEAPADGILVGVKAHAGDVIAVGKKIASIASQGELPASDVLALAELKTADRATELETLGSVGRLMAERTTQSWTTVPHFFV